MSCWRDIILTCFIIAALCRTALLCYSLASALRVASGCSKIWGKHLNTTNEQLEPATSRPRAYWRFIATCTARVRPYLCELWDSVQFVSGGTASVELLMTRVMISSYLLAFLSCSGGGHVALHPFLSVLFRSRTSPAAAPVRSGQRCPPLLEHREPVCPFDALLHAPSPPSPQRRGCHLPVDCRDGINKFGGVHAKRSPSFTRLKQPSVHWWYFNCT